MSMKSFILGGLAGYVLGAKAGRRRYEQIVNVSSKVWHSSPVEAGREKVHDAASDAFEGAKSKVTDVISHARGQEEPRPYTATEPVSVRPVDF